VLRKIALILWGSVISFLLGTQVGSAESLVVPPLAEEEKAYKAWLVAELDSEGAETETFFLWTRIKIEKFG